MSRARTLGLAGLVAVAIAGAAIGLGSRQAPPAPKPQLALLTSLPLLFGERFGLDGGGSPALTRIERDYAVHPIAVADAPSLTGQQLLLMAHPRAQPAEALVELDQWVRRGGHVLLLADPRLDWPSERPLGDRLRPPPWFADTGLLGHWGLKLTGPDPEGPATMQAGDFKVALSSPGRLVSAIGGSCAVERGGLIARCRVGRGQAVVVADADFLNVPAERGDNLDFLEVELARLATH